MVDIWLIYGLIPSGNDCYIAKMAIEIVSFPIVWWFSHQIMLVYQRVGPRVTELCKSQLKWCYVFPIAEHHCPPFRGRLWWKDALYGPAVRFHELVLHGVTYTQRYWNQKRPGDCECCCDRGHTWWYSGRQCVFFGWSKRCGFCFTEFTP